MNNFVLTGIAGYVAPRHLAAIRDTNCRLIAALDPHDSVGVLDNYFPETEYFSDVRHFERFISLRNTSAGTKNKISYMTICSPNYLHYSQITMALNLGLDVICEKPLVLTSNQVHKLVDLEQVTGHRVYPIMQLRYHPMMLNLKELMSTKKRGVTHHDVRLTYVTSRGNWYLASWKGNPEKSGGLAMAIGIHFFDILSWLFGEVKESYVHIREAKRMAGFLEMETASVEWFLSIDNSDLPIIEGSNTGSALRLIEINNKAYDFSDGFNNLHTICYQKILSANGLRAIDSLNSIEIIEYANRTKVSNNGRVHPLAKQHRS